MVAKDGEYALFSDGKLVIYQKSDDGRDMGLANTFRVNIKGDSMHVRGFILQPSPINGKENQYTLSELMDKNTSLSIGYTFIDEWWIVDPIPIDPNAFQIPEIQLNFSTKQTSY